MNKTTEYPSQSVTLNSNGEGMAEFGPAVSNAHWVITNMGTVGNSAQPPRLSVYRNAVAPNGFLCGSDAANNDSNNDRIELMKLERLFFVWTGGSPGAVMTGTLVVTQYQGV